MSAKNSAASTAATQSDREIVLSRVFDAPRELVWKAWTDPKHIVNWWGPRGFSQTIEVMDLRPSGKWKHTMHGPDGAEYPSNSVFTEVVKYERISIAHDGGKKGGPQSKFDATWTFEEVGDKTKITLRMVFESAQEVERVIKVFGAIEGGNQTLARLAEYLPSLGNANDSPTGELSLTRVFDAPRELVWSAWTDAKHLAQWWGPQGYTNPVREVDARPGGAIRIQMIALDGTVYPIKGEFKEVVTPERLVFVETICVPSDTSDGAQNLLFELLNTITFAEQAGKTNVTIKARVLRMTAAGAPYAAGMEEGWMQSLDRLAVFLAKR